MNKTYIKNILRDIKKTKGKVFSIGVMVGLATMVIVALSLTGPSMRKSLRNSLKDYGHPDIIVRSTYPMDYEDKILLEVDSDIDDISYIKTADLMDGEKIIRLKSFDRAFPKFEITEGRQIENDKEIIVDKSLRKYYKLGDNISLSYINDDQKINSNLENTVFKVVGYFSSSEKFMEDMRSLSVIGKKEIEGFAYVDDSNFPNDKFNEVNISYKETFAMDKTSDEYLSYIRNKKDKIEDDIYQRPKELTKQIRSDANESISEAEDEIKKSEDKLSDTEKKLKTSKNEIDQGFRDYESNKREFEKEIKDAENKLSKSRVDLENGQQKLDASKDLLTKSQEDYDKNIPANEEEISAKLGELTAAENDLNGKKTEIQNKLSEIEKIYQKQLQALESQEIDGEEIDDDEPKITNEAKKEELLASINEQKAPLLKALGDIEGKEAEVKAGLGQTRKAQEDLYAKKEESLRKIESAKAEIDQRQREINQAWTQYYQGIDELEANKKAGRKELEDAYKTLISSKAQYDQDLKDFEDKKGQALKKIEDGKDKIEDKKKALIRLKDPKYEVETIFNNQGLDTYYRNSLNMDSLAKVFPVFFYMVAMLVTLTTMKRYIQEQRLINGTLKSLGYSNKMIAKRFYIYGLIPTVIGSIIGGILGRFIIVDVIFNAYSTGFEILDVSYVNSLWVIIGSIILSSILVSLTVYLTSKATVKESPARLLQNQVPVKGSKIFLERLGPIWKRLSFMQKITARNLFRYKSRMFMTVFGVAGCTALIFFGFAMIDSLKDTASIQQNELHNYKVVSILDEMANADEKNSYKEKLKGYDRLEIRNEDAMLGKDETELDLSVVIPNSENNFKDFVKLRQSSKNPIALGEKKAVLTENASKELKIKPGDKINIKVNGKNFDIKIGAIAENYVGDYLYLSKEYYEDLSKEKLLTNANYIKGDPKTIIENLEDTEIVLAAINTGKAYSSMDALLNNLNLVIVVITLISSILASVVLYNITDINVSERKRELATIKVLGFYPREVTSYIYREIFILTILGIIFGYGLGYLMFRYIIDLVAPRNIMLAYKLHPLSFVVSAGITLILSLLILIYIHKKLNKIDMAEAMSSGE